jgi:long-chain acyl-CoA synthetase
MFEDLELPTIDPATPIDDVLHMLTADGMPFATKQESIRGYDMPVFVNAPATLRDVWNILLGHGDKEYIVYGDERYSFTDIVGKASQFAQALVDDFDIQKGDRVAVAMRNYPEWPVAYMGIVAAGGVAVLMNAWWGTEELDWAMKDCGAKVAVADAPRGAAIREANADVPVIVARDAMPEGQHFYDFNDALEGKKPLSWPAVEIATDDVAMMLYTSGSTGFPKGAYSDHRAVIGVLFNWIVVALSLKMLGRTNPDPDFQPIMMVAVPFFHVTGLLPVMLVSAVVGRKLVLMHKWDVEEGFRLIETEGVTAFTGVPTMSYEMAASPLRSKYDLSSLTDIGGGGAARPPEHVKLISEAFEGSSPGIGYGLTETGALGALLSGEEYLERPTSTGKPTPPMVELKIAGPDGQSLPAGVRGEVCMKSSVNVIGYWNNQEATDRAFKDGWFHSGDVGYLDDDGYLYIVDRMKDIIIRGGENISTLEVEGILHGHDSVKDVMVVSLPCPRMGEIVGAVVVPQNGSFDEAKLLADSATHLAKFKLPEKIWVRSEPMPLIASGKIDRQAVKAEYLELWEAEQKETN